MSKTQLKNAAFVVGVMIAVAAVQRHVMAVPVIGTYLPN